MELDPDQRDIDLGAVLGRDGDDHQLSRGAKHLTRDKAFGMFMHRQLGPKNWPNFSNRSFWHDFLIPVALRREWHQQ